MADARDPLCVIAEICQLQPEGALEKIAETLGLGEQEVAGAIRAARNSAFEAAAQVCDAEAARTGGGTGYATSRTLARSIRKLKTDAPHGVAIPLEGKDAG